MPVVRNSVKRYIHSGPRNGAILTDNTCELLLLPRYNSKPEKRRPFYYLFSCTEWNKYYGNKFKRVAREVRKNGSVEGRKAIRNTKNTTYRWDESGNGPVLRCWQDLPRALRHWMNHESSWKVESKVGLCSRQVSSSRIDCTSERAQLSHIRSPSGIAKRKSPSDGSQSNWTMWGNELWQFTREERAVSRLWPADKGMYIFDIIMFRSDNYSCHSTDDKNNLRITF